MKLAFVAVALMAASAQAAALRYELIDVGTLGGPGSSGFGLNDKGEVVGHSDLPPGPQGDPRFHAFLYSAGTIVDLGSAIDTPFRSLSVAYAINDRGDAVGRTEMDFGAQAALFTGGRVIPLGVLVPGGGWSVAQDINKHGMIVGTSVAAPGGDGPYQAFVWEGGVMRALPTLGSYAYGNAVNDAGVVVGISDGRAVRWIDGEIQTLPTLGGTNSNAADINKRGQIVGYASDAGGASHAVIWEDGTVRSLGHLGGGTSFATSINDRGDVVGYSYTADMQFRPFLYRDGVMLDLYDLLPVSSG